MAWAFNGSCDAEKMMNDVAAKSASYNKRVNWIVHIIVTFVILIVAVGVIMAMFSSKPEAQRWGGARQAPSVAVDVTDLEQTDFQVWIDSYGTAQPLTQTLLVSDVNARVLSVSNNIRAGKSFKKNEILVQLDDRDLLVEVQVAASAAAEAELRYLQEVAESEIAAQQWNERPVSEAARLLALRKPQVNAAKAALNAAEARLARAKLDLERTKIRAPFDGKVLMQMVDVGQVISPSQAIAEIYSTEAVEVRLPVKVSDLAYLELQEELQNNETPPRVSLIGDLGNRTYEWSGQIVRSEGAFDPATRMLYLVAQIEQPFTASAQRPAIRIGQFLRAKIEGEALEDVFIIPRRAVSQDFRVSVVEDGFLRKRKISPLWTDADSVVVAGDNSDNLRYAAGAIGELPAQIALKASDKLILTPTANLPDGTRVKPLISKEEEQDRPERIVTNGEQSASTASLQTKSSAPGNSTAVSTAIN
jgi:RND family efflux transporter MFP subunit